MSGALFTQPRQHAFSTADGRLLAGAKLRFDLAGTTTPVSIFADATLDTPHTNPVVADAAGVFPAIYLDGQYDYRVRYYTSADVLLWDEDPYPAGNDVGRTHRLEHTAPELVFFETDASTDNQAWRVRVNAEVLSLDVGNSNESSWVSALQVARSGVSAGTLTYNGNSIDLVGTGSSSGFTATLNNSGFLTQLSSNNHVLIISSRASGNVNLRQSASDGNVTVTIGSTEVARFDATTTRLRNQIRVETVLTPNQITANQNNYEPTGIANAAVLRLSTDASRNITGIAGGAHGRELRIVNIGSFDVVLTNNDAGSLGANRFLLGANITVGSGEGIILWYDGDSGAWRCFGKHV